jgi:hypothetical protein
MKLVYLDCRESEPCEDEGLKRKKRLKEDARVGRKFVCFIGTEMR